MNRPTDEQNIRKFLTPFADGELDVEQSLRVLEHMAMNPPATKRVMHQQQLRRSIARYFTDHTPAAPAELTEKLKTLFPPPQEKPANVYWWRMSAFVAAAIVLLTFGAWIGRTTKRSQPLAAGPTVAPAAAIAPASQPVSPIMVGVLLRTHVNCARFATHTSSDLFPADLANLPASVKRYLDADFTPPKFDDLHYHFAGAEPCQIPGGKTVHLLYRGEGSLRHDAISLFVQRDEGQLKILAGDSYSAAASHAAHPLVVWRSKGLVYYVIGDNADIVKRAAKLAGAPA
jgi:anti-sigma factor RsiW